MKDSSIKWIWVSVLMIALDQWSKYLASDFLQYREALVVFSGFNLTLIHNTGAAFSFLGDAGGWQRWLFIILSSGISLVILFWLCTLPPQRRVLALGLSFILGGAIGNLIDRIRLGYAVDFIDVYYQNWHWPVFNIADSVITVGAILLIIDTI